MTGPGTNSGTLDQQSDSLPIALWGQIKFPSKKIAKLPSNLNTKLSV